MSEKKSAEFKKFKVTIHSGTEDGDRGDVVLVHNCHQIQIQRDKEVVIDERFIEVLKHSVIHTTTKNEKGDVIPVTIPRFSYSVEAV